MRRRLRPCFLIAGEEVHIIPASLNFENFAAYEGAAAEFKMFPERCHWIVGQPGWQDVAQYVGRRLKAN
jgi:hypothetical protein